MNMPKNWSAVLGDEIAKPYFVALQEFVAAERAQHQIFPPDDQVYGAFELTAFDKVRVVILGQDPYHDVGQAHGLAFSVQPGVKLPASLRNIFKELHDDVGVAPSKNGCLTHWAEQGVLLLNAVLTVRAHQANSHKGKGWETFTNIVIERLGEREEPIIFVLWGKPAQSKKNLVDTTKHVVLEAAHPSPLSAHSGFFGCKHFSKINTTLASWGRPTIDWKIPS